MNPLRLLVAGLTMLGVAIAHRRAVRQRKRCEAGDHDWRRTGPQGGRCARPGCEVWRDDDSRLDEIPDYDAGGWGRPDH